MSKARVMLCVSFALVFAAGICVGILAVRCGEGPQRGGSWLSDELNLTPAQREQMHQTWSDVMRTAGEGQRERSMALRKERDESARALLTDEQKAKYDKLLEDYAKKLDGLSQERKARFEEAVEKTKRILTEEQRKKYEELLEKRPRGPHRGYGGAEPRDGRSRSQDVNAQ